MRRRKRISLAALGLLSGGSVFAAGPVDLSKLPPAASQKIEFDRDIKPIFEKSCFRCHGPERPKSHFRLDQRAAALKGGDDGVDILPGKSAESPLIHYVSHLSEEFDMPPEGKGDPLTAQEVGLLRAWIDQGAVYGVEASGPEIRFAVTTGVRYVAVSGDQNKFREQQWSREGWAGGLERLTLQERTTNGVVVTAEARALFDQSDYLMKLRLEKPDFGFVQFGFEQYRRYTDDSGVVFPGYPLALSSLGQGFGEDIGRSWMDVGLTLPNWPKLTLGYEHQYREGEKSSLEYDFVSPDIATDPNGRALLPTRRRLDEDVHVIKFGLDHEIRGVHIEDDFRGEFYDLKSDRERDGVLAAGSRSGYNGARETDHETHFQGVNAFTLEKQLRDWLFVSGGYLFSRLDGDAEFDRTIFVPVNPNAPSFLGEDSNGIVINQETHAFSLTSALGPWDGLSFYGSLQNEWLRQHGLGSSNVRPSLTALPGSPLSEPSNFDSDLDRATFNEIFGLKYTKIPFTVVHADAQWQQEDSRYYERFLLQGGTDDHDDILQDSDARARLQLYRAGFTVSPWTQAALSAEYKVRDKTTDYDHVRDQNLNAPSGNGYPAFIRERDIFTHGLETKLALRPARWLRTTLKYELASTDYHSATDPVDDGAGGLSGGGKVFAGNYDAHIYSVNATVAPWQRLSVSATFSYSQSRLVTWDNNSAQVVPYAGDIYSVISSATFVVNAKTDLQASYYFSQADYAQANAPAGVPLGIAYDRHGLLGGVTHRWKPNLSTKLQYGYFRYDEPSTQGINNYDAHAIFVSMTYSL